jgi:hypothetical protein
MHSVYVIYKDGQPLEGHSAGIKRNAFDKKGSANSVVTHLINTYLTWELHFSEWRDGDKWKEEEKKERARYEVVEYVRKV